MGHCLRWTLLLSLAALIAGCAPSGTTERGLTRLTRRASTEGGWMVTVYYTAVESFHSDKLVPVRGCPVLECTRGNHFLGRYPASFVSAVETEGTGRITSGASAGRYLNWASSEGFWLDDAPRDAQGRSLEPMRSAASDGLAQGTRVRLVGCGKGDGGEAVPPAVCSRLQSGNWEIRDEFTPGLGGERHIDLYVGEEDGPGFTSSPIYTTLYDATLELMTPG